MARLFVLFLSYRVFEFGLIWTYTTKVSKYRQQKKKVPFPGWFSPLPNKMLQIFFRMVKRLSCFPFYVFSCLSQSILSKLLIQLQCVWATKKNLFLYLLLSLPHVMWPTLWLTCVDTAEVIRHARDQLEIVNLIFTI